MCCSSLSLLPLRAMTMRILLLLFLMLNGPSAIAGLNHTRRPVSSLRLARIQRHLDTVNKPAVRSIQSPDGDVIDCVRRHEQPALDHPLLQDHKIQLEGPEMPKLSSNDSVYPAEGSRQAWHRAGHCPEGTVPIRRSGVDDVLRARSLYHFGKKRMKSYRGMRSSDAPDVVSGNGHEHAIAYTAASEEVYGAKATINVWDPTIQGSNEFSLSQIWVLSGSFDGSDLNSIEAGWQVSPELYGDSNPRLFTYWTSDAYQATGCYNLLCSGFVQTNNKIAIGASISPISSDSGSQYEITILIWKDPKLGHWWLSYGDGTLVGYWPAELFTHLADRATMVEWGGEVVNMREDGGHTATRMGSGRFAGDGFRRASYFRNLQVVDADNSLSSAMSITTLAENTNCYNIESSSSSDWGTYFYYGGPGKNPKCP